jgi:peptidoglycan/LPS O-acetylase OafA/YrhL
MQKYFKSLDGIRGVTICFVILYHYLRLHGTDPSVMGFSWIFIQMFFVQSGFLITSILLRSKHQPFNIYAREFYWRRMLRIFPAYFLYILLFVVLYAITQKPADLLQRIPYLLTFTYNYTRLIPDLNFNSIWFIHFWSLAVEEQFYLVWPVLIYFLGPKSLKRLIVSLIVLAPVFRFWLANYLVGAGYSYEMTGEIVYAFTLSQFDAFAFGAAIPLFKLDVKIVNPGKWVFASILLVAAIGLANYYSIRSVQPDFSLSSLGLSVARIDNLQHVWSYSVVNLLFLFVILRLINTNYKGLFNFSPFVLMGKVVYGIYIYHFAILFGLFHLNNLYLHNFVLSLLVASAISVLLAYLSYTYYEKKFLSWKDWWSSEKESR